MICLDHYDSERKKQNHIQPGKLLPDTSLDVQYHSVICFMDIPAQVYTHS